MDTFIAEELMKFDRWVDLAEFLDIGWETIFAAVPWPEVDFDN